MLALPDIAQNTIYESAHALVDRGVRDDGLAIVIKRLQEEYPSPQAITPYKQADVIPQSERNRQGIQLVAIGGRHRRSQGTLTAIYEEAA